jgi:histidyl-tRNA synthetase
MSKEKKIKGKVFQTPKGMHDVVPSESLYWEKIESVVKNISKEHNFSHIETPILEFADLYNKTTGDSSDIVHKEMYILKTKGDDVLALRPEYTPGICRAYLEHRLNKQGQPQKFFALGPVFRHDRPQLGRYRQFTQAEFDILGGVADSIYDAELISMAIRILSELKIKNIIVKINSVGCKTCRPVFKKQLQNYYKNNERKLCSDCRRRLYENPLRLLDCKNESCVKLKENAPVFFDKLCSNCTDHFKSVLEYLEEANIPYSLDNNLVRGLDYYNRTVFEIFADGEEEKIGALGGGGRFDYLMEIIGGSSTSAIGFSLGVERIIAVLKARGIDFQKKAPKRIFFAHAGELAKKKAFSIINYLRNEGIVVLESLTKESLSSQLKLADKEKIEIAIILGQKEIFENNVIVRDLVAGTQETIPLEKLLNDIKRRM